MAPLHGDGTATRTGSGYRIDGVKDRVEAGAESGVLLVVADCDGEIRQFLVPTDAPGVEVDPQNSVDMVKRYARVQFDGVEVDESAVVGTAEQTAGVIERQRQIALVLQCAEIVGILDAVMDFTVQWLFDRHRFGRPLASYQALKHRAADMKMWLEACRATTRGAVADVSRACARRRRYSVSVAKAYVGERAPVMLQDCVQMHGGIGVTWEHDLHLYLRRVALYRAMFGSPEDHHLRVYALSKKQESPMTETTSMPIAATESVEEFAERAAAWLAENMPRIDPANPPVRRPRRRGAVAAGPRTAEAALRGRLRRHLLPRRIRRARSALRLPEGVRRRIAQSTRCR